MDAGLEQRILEAFSESLKLPEPIQEARQDWITTTQQIAQVVVLSSDEPPVSTDRLYGMASRAEQKNQYRQLRDFAKQAFVKTIKKKHDEALKKAGGVDGLKNLSSLPKGVLTRSDIYSRYSHYNIQVPSKLANRWQLDIIELNKKIDKIIRLRASQLKTAFRNHNKKCENYKRGGCIRGLTADEKSAEIAFAPTGTEEKVGLRDRVTSDLETVIHNTQTNRGTRTCTEMDLPSLITILNLVENAENEHREKFSRGMAIQSKILTADDFADIADDRNMSQAMLREYGIDIKKPLLAVRTPILDMQIIQKVLEEFEHVSRYGDEPFEDVDAYVENLKNDKTAYEQLYVDLETTISDEDLKDSYKFVIDNWKELKKDFYKETSTKHAVDPANMSVGGIDINYAVPGSTYRHELSDVPRHPDDVDRPTLVQIYNDVRSGKIESGKFSWVVILGTAESALRSSKDGKCPVCSGSGIVTAKDISITVAGSQDEVYWNEFYRIQDDYEGSNAESHKCAHCEGTGKVHPNMWLTLRSELTPYELVVKSVWEVLVQQGLEPVPFDGFLPEDDQPDGFNFPIPAPARPQVQSHYERPVTGESNVLGYTTIIRLDNPMGRDRVKSKTRVSNRGTVQAYFVEKVVEPLGNLLKSYQMAYGLEDSDRGVSDGQETAMGVKARAPKQELRIWGFQKQPRYKFRRERQDLKRRDVDGDGEDYFIPNDSEDFDKQVLGIEASEESRDWTPSQTFLSELVKLKAMANEFENIGQKDLALVIYSYLGMENILKGQKRIISNYDEMVGYGAKFSYSELIESLLHQVKKRSESIKYIERFEGGLERLQEKAYRFDFEKRTDIGIELKLYLRATEALKRMQMRALFKPGTRELKTGEKVYSTEDIYAIASRVNKVFENFGSGSPNDNPTPYILIPIGGEISARYYADVDDMQIMQELAPAFQKAGQLETLKKLYWRSQADGQRLLNVLRQEASNPKMGIEPAVSKLREKYPKYGHVDAIVNQFQNDNSEDPRVAFMLFFRKGYSMTLELYKSVSEDKLHRFYSKIRREGSKVSPESDLNKLEAFSDAAATRLGGSAKRKRERRLNQKINDLASVVSDQERQQQENETWITKYMRFKEKPNLAEANPKIELERELANNIIKIMKSGVKYSNSIQSMWHLESIVQSLTQISPYFEKWFHDKGLSGFQLEGLFEPGTDNSDDQIDKAIELTDDVLDNIFRRTEDEYGNIEARNPDGVRDFFEKLL